MFDFFEFSNEMLCIADSGGYFVRLNQTWTKTLGWSIEELLSRAYVEFVHPADVGATIREEELLVSGTHETISFENRYRAKDGTYRWLAWYARLDPDSKRIVATARDITEQKLQTAALRESEDRFATFMDNSPALAWAKDDQGRYVYLNKAHQEHFGIRLADWLGKTDFDLWPAEVARQLECKCDPDIGLLPESTQTTAYRVIQEALNNAKKHSGTSAAAVAIQKAGGDLHIEIRDHGRGFDVLSARQRGFGLRGMAERAQLAGGTCVIQSQPGAGTTVRVRLPIRANDEG